ncbi:DUF1232 domain-containing protein [Persicirhabdus sediminis]|uniref:DUF1232 domain-containing protein n=1 Tax=Persicirhabdus sediminis TaxID=454144 RepID=A0A8J7MGX5_9BACT|nr:DUF1232 domain-containing protein [Persicirhabdus sediminis]MBK1792608.1 DUF1232 domain-containing protein [Persicirhabdus sediminis]
MKTFAVLLLAIISATYILNPTAGLLELIPDNIPIFGNLDEAMATAILLACLGYFGIDVSKLFSQSPSVKRAQSQLDETIERGKSLHKAEPK